MQFIDEITLEVRAGDGGNGSAAMRREKYRPLGGPAGGDGGHGGDVVFVADPRLSTLLDLRYKRVLKAPHGEHGRGKDQYGKSGEELRVRVPVGTQVFDAESGELLADLDQANTEAIVARGGRGGRGNLHFVTSTERAPLRAEPGRPGQRRQLRIELKLLADVGVIGFPNVGKSTFIAAVSKARPKVGDYPFTTLSPNLGVVSRGNERSFVVADIPGIIQGAAEGAGLGHRFLKHVERTRVLLHLLTLDPEPGRAMLTDYDVLNRELEKFDPALATRPAIVAVSKLDLPEVRAAYPEFERAMQARGIRTWALSAATGEGLEPLLDAIERELSAHPLRPAPRPHALPNAADRPHARAQHDAGLAEDGED